MSLIQTLWDRVKGAREVVAGAPVQHILAKMVPKDRVDHGSDPFPELVAGDRFDPGGNYFGIRLAGINLAKARRFTREVLPLCVCLAEFGRPGAERTVPFSVSPATIRQKLKAAGVSEAAGADQAWIELRDLTVLRPTPVRAGNLSLYVGLYSVPGDDVVATLLDVMGGLGGSLAISGLAPAVETAKAVYGGFESLLGLNKVQPQAEAINGRALPGTGSGYLLVGNAPDDELERRDLRIRGGALCDAAGKLVVDFDYCLVAIEHYATIVEQATGTAPDLFEDAAAAVQTALNDEDEAGYLRTLKKLIHLIDGSTEVTEADKDLLTSGYAALFEKRANRLLAARGGGRGPGSNLSLELSAQGGALQTRNPTLSKGMYALYGHITDAPDDADGAGRDETPAQLWSAVRAEAAAIRARVKTQPGEITAAIARAADSTQPAL